MADITLKNLYQSSKQLLMTSDTYVLSDNIDYRLDHPNALYFQDRWIDYQQIESDLNYLIQEVIHCPRYDIICYPEKKIGDYLCSKFRSCIEKRAKGIPIAYILKKAYFYSRSFDLSTDCLIPRPESEGLIDLAKKAFKSDQDINILDLGAGSGNLSITLGLEFPNSTVQGWDICSKALKIAKKNKLNLGGKNVEFYQKDMLMLSNFEVTVKSSDKFDLIVANPPYVSSNDHHLLAKDIYHEPKHALFADDDGMLFFSTTICRYAPMILSDKPGSVIISEIGFNQKKAIDQLCKDLNQNNRANLDYQFYQDYNSKDRYLLVQYQ